VLPSGPKGIRGSDLGQTVQRQGMRARENEGALEDGEEHAGTIALVGFDNSEKARKLL